MNSRQRVLSALNHVEPDRVPIDFSGHRSSGIAAIAYRKLRKHLGLSQKPIRIYDIIQQLAIVDNDLLDYFGVDTIEMGRAFALKEEDWSDWILPDGTECQVPAWSVPEREKDRWILRSKTGKIIGQMPDGALYFEQVYYPFFDGVEDINDLSRAFDDCIWTTISAPPGPVSDEKITTTAKKFREKENRAIIGLFGGNLLEIGQMFYRNDHFLMKLADEPKKVHQFLDKLVERHLCSLKKFLNNVGPYIDIILFGDDLGMQSGPQISPKMYREFFKPRQRIMWERTKELADVKIMLHCCGGVYELLADLIDAGLDAINPVQISCGGMDSNRLNREFGRDITFWGGACDTRFMLPSGTPQQINNHVKEQVEIFQPGGGFVFQQVHNILPGVPPENILAMFEAVKDFN